MPDYLDSVFFFIINGQSSPSLELHISKSRHLFSIRVPALYVVDINVLDYLSTESRNKNAFFGNS